MKNNWYKAARKSYLDIGHNIDSYAWAISGEELIVSPVYDEFGNSDLHGDLESLYNNVWAKGRIDNKSKKISIVMVEGDKEDHDYLVNLFKMDYPDYQIVDFNYIQ